MLNISFDNSYARLPERFFSRTRPTAVREPKLVKFNDTLAAELGIGVDGASAEELAAFLSGNRIADGSEPIAMAYSGHQFGTFVPQLGDGRAILLGEVIDSRGRRRDLQLKGSGRTPWSRGGDGRAAIGPVLREYIVSEAMHALGIPTTRSLAVVTTGESVVRDEILPGAVLTRVASSHVRVGTFEYFASRGDEEAVRLLADYVTDRHAPHAMGTARPYRALFESIVKAQAELIASWLLVGFIHGVMNTDNMSVAGETIDYGPCAFIDEYDPRKVFSSIDRSGRYAYANQPSIGAWNLMRLAECLLPLLAEKEEEAVDIANQSLSIYGPTFDSAYTRGLYRKLGLVTKEEGDAALAHDLLNAMSANHADFTLTFRRLSDGDPATRKLFDDPGAFDAWEEKWRARVAREPAGEIERREAMRRANPAFIPRNHRVEAAIREATERNDFRLFEQLVTVISKPYDDQPRYAEYLQPPLESERVLRTFCGT